MSSSPHSIPLAEAVVMTERARQAHLLSKKAWRFDRDIYDMILANPKAKGIRTYMALKKDGEPTLVIVGTDEQGKDLTDGDIGEEAAPCPPYCDGDSPLNHCPPP